MSINNKFITERMLMEVEKPTQQQREDTLIMQVKPIELING
jgi:hypothetical protein